MYTVDFKRELNLLDIEWTSIFPSDAVADYARKVYECYAREGVQPGYLLRMDMRRSAVQPQDALPAFRQHFLNFPKARRIAIVTPSAIARFQVRRIMTQSYLELFDEPESALEWLLDDGAMQRMAQA